MFARGSFYVFTLAKVLLFMICVWPTLAHRYGVLIHLPVINSVLNHLQPSKDFLRILFWLKSVVCVVAKTLQLYHHQQPTDIQWSQEPAQNLFLCQIKTPICLQSDQFCGQLYSQLFLKTLSHRFFFLSNCKRMEITKKLRGNHFNFIIMRLMSIPLYTK